MDARDADGQDGGEELETPETTTTPSDERSFRQPRNDRQRESRGALRRWEFLPTPTMELREFSSVRPWGAPVDEIEQQRLVGSDRGAEGDELEPAADPGRWYRPASVHLPDATDDQSTRLTLPRWSSTSPALLTGPARLARLSLRGMCLSRSPYPARIKAGRSRRFSAWCEPDFGDRMVLGLGDMQCPGGELDACTGFLGT